MQRIKWTIEEVVAMVDIYFRYENGEIDDLNSELIRLSETLNKRADILNIKHDNKFRNFNGMKCIFQNVRYVATNGEVGLSSASKLHYDVIDMYHNEKEKFDGILEEFHQKYY